MPERIVFVTPFADSSRMADSMAPPGFDFLNVAGGSPEYHAALADASYLVGFVSGLIQTELFAAAPNLKLVQVLSAGYDNADVEAARAAGVPVANNGGANSVAVSEHAVMLMLACARSLPWQHASVTGGRWTGNDTPRVFELRGKTLGIVGLGSIGKKVARLAQAFGMTVTYYDIRRLSEDQEDALGVRFRLLDEILEAADVVTLHVPLNESTHHLINADRLARMQASSILVNTSRGPVVDETALTEALTARQLFAAGLDVFNDEPPAPDNALFALDNVVLTPHLAGPTYESHEARIRNGFDNVQRVARGEAPLWVIPELG